MKDYSYSELKEMQERAMERVRAMQQKANETVTAAGNDLIKTGNREYDNGDSPSSTQKSERQHHIKMPANMPSRTKPAYQPFSDFFSESQPKAVSQSAPVQNHNTSPLQHSGQGGGILDSLMNEPDRAMLLPLLLLLRSDGADEALMMSLLYIMS